MKTQELRSKSATELKGELKTLLQEQFNLRMQKAVGQVAKPHLFKNVRRNIAQIKTILREKVGE